MTRAEAVSYIDRGAEFYIDLFSRAEHMEKVKREHYSFVRPKGDIYGIRFVYEVRLDGLPPEELREQAAEIKALEMPVWLGLGTSREAVLACTGRETLEPPGEPSMEDEAYMWMQERPEYTVGTEVTEVKSQAEFAEWAGVVNGVLGHGKEDLHPVYHYPLCRDGLLRCYMVRGGDGRAVSAAAAAVDREAVSLEFVATVPERRRQGLARAVCRRVVSDAFEKGAGIVTVRAVDGVAARLYESIGFERLS